MGDRKLVLISNTEEIPISYSVLSAYTEKGLLYTAASGELHLLLREPALLELARRGHPATVGICKSLLEEDGAEELFLALRVLVILSTPEAVQVIMNLLDSHPFQSRRLSLQMLGKVVTPMFREKFRLVLRKLVIPGVLDVSRWTPTALRVLRRICDEEEIEVVETHSDESIPVPHI